MTTPTAGRQPQDPKTNRMLFREPQYCRPAFICSCVLVLFYTESPRVIQTGRSLSLRSDNFAAVIDCNSIRRQTGVRVFRALDNFSRRASHLLSDCAFARGVLCFPEHGGAAV